MRGLKFVLIGIAFQITVTKITLQILVIGIASFNDFIQDKFEGISTGCLKDYVIHIERPSLPLPLRDRHSKG
jgi:hypothetical protein